MEWFKQVIVNAQNKIKMNFSCANLIFYQILTRQFDSNIFVNTTEMQDSPFSSHISGDSSITESENSMITKLRRENKTLKNSIETYQKTKNDTIQRYKTEMQMQLETIKKNIEEQYRQRQAEWQMKKSKRQKTSESQQSSYKSAKNAMFLLNRIEELQKENTQHLDRLREQEEHQNMRYQALEKKYEEIRMKLSQVEQKASSNSEGGLQKIELQKQKQKNKELAKAKMDLSRKIDAMKEKIKKYEEMQKLSKQKTQSESTKERINDLQAQVQQYKQRIKQSNNSLSELEYMLSEEKELNRKLTEQNLELLNSISQLKEEIAKQVPVKNNSQRLNGRNINIYFEDFVSFVKFYFDKLQNRQSKFKALHRLRKQLESIHL